jgi:hypothetical protein
MESNMAEINSAKPILIPPSGDAWLGGNPLGYRQPPSEGLPAKTISAK